MSNSENPPPIKNHDPEYAVKEAEKIFKRKGWNRDKEAENDRLGVVIVLLVTLLTLATLYKAVNDATEEFNLLIMPTDKPALIYPSPTPTIAEWNPSP